MPVENTAFPQITKYFDPETLQVSGVKVVFSDDEITYIEQSNEFDMGYSIVSGMVSLFLREKVHPKKLWKYFHTLPPQLSFLVMEEARFFLKSHDRDDPFDQGHSVAYFRQTGFATPPPEHPTLTKVKEVAARKNKPQPEPAVSLTKELAKVKQAAPEAYSVANEHPHILKFPGVG